MNRTRVCGLPAALPSPDDDVGNGTKKTFGRARGMPLEAPSLERMAHSITAGRRIRQTSSRATRWCATSMPGQDARHRSCCPPPASVLRCKATISYPSTTAMLAAGLAGLGVLHTLRLVAQPHIDAGRLTPLLEKWSAEPNPISVVYAPNRHLSARVRVFVDWMVQLFEALARGDAPKVRQIPRRSYRPRSPPQPASLRSSMPTVSSSLRNLAQSLQALTRLEPVRRERRRRSLKRLPHLSFETVRGRACSINWLRGADCARRHSASFPGGTRGWVVSRQRKTRQRLERMSGGSSVADRGESTQVPAPSRPFAGGRSSRVTGTSSLTHPIQ